MDLNDVPRQIPVALKMCGSNNNKLLLDSVVSCNPFFPTKGPKVKH